MKRTLEQNSLIHAFFGEISEFLTQGGITCSSGMVKELCKMTLGNTTEFLGTKIAMPTSSYARSDIDLTPAQHRADMISMESFITKIQAWASTDLNLELTSPNEETV